MTRAPLIGITSDLVERSPGRWSATAAMAYSEKVRAAGGVPVILPPIAGCVRDHLGVCEGFVFTGGNDPDMTQWGIATHPRATVMHPQRQEYETTLLGLLRREHPDTPVLGICLGMQLMCLDAGGRLDQHLTDSLATADQHRNADHDVKPALTTHEGCPAWLAPGGLVASNHHQSVIEPGPGLRVLARSGDGVIEAVGDQARHFYLGVQWHPERTADPRLGLDVFRALVLAALDKR